MKKLLFLAAAAVLVGALTYGTVEAALRISRPYPGEPFSVRGRQLCQPTLNASQPVANQLDGVCVAATPTRTPTLPPSATATSTPTPGGPTATPQASLTPTPTPTPGAGGNLVVITSGSGFSRQVASNTTYRCADGVILNGNNSVTRAFYGTASNVTIENCRITNYRSAFQEAAVQTAGNGWLVQNNNIYGNYHGGIDAGGDNMRILNNHVYSNGMYGIAGGDDPSGPGTNLLIQDNEVNNNNTRNLDPAFEAGGGKVTNITGVTFRGNHYHHNNGPGIWLDESVFAALVELNNVHDEVWSGIFYEISGHGIVRNNTLVHNGYGDTRGAFWRGQILVAASDHVEVYGNNVSGDANGSVPVRIIQQDRGGWTNTGDSFHDNGFGGQTFADAWDCDEEDLGAARCNQIAASITWVRN